MKRRTLPEPTLHIDPTWHPPLIPWRTHAHWRKARWAYAAWWASGAWWYGGRLPKWRAMLAGKGEGPRL